MTNTIEEAEQQIYFNCESRLKQVVNSKATAENILFFIEAIQNFKQVNKLIDKPTATDLSYLISKEYLKNLVVGSKKQQSNKISKLLKASNLKTDLVFRYTTKRNGYGTIKEKEKINLIVI